ncbi:MAG: DUF4390 domain-containing protein [Candidatus Latescibacterota bacterium]|nr:MAG: DUF4390 domain-containing protein [Candidatus Latescibacterota bacterium]
MRVSRSWLQAAPIAFALVATVATGVRAAEIRVDRIAATSQGFLYLEYELVTPFEGIYFEAIQSGLPTTLNYTIEVWRQRSGWWDKLEDTYEREFRLLHDVLNGEYLVNTSDETTSFSTLDSLTAAVCRFQRGSREGPEYFSPQLFSPDDRYYVVITATLAPLTVEDLNELDTWLRGTLGGREDSGGISGLSRTIGGLLMSMTGFGDRRVKLRTRDFRPRDLEPEPRRLEVPQRPQPAATTPAPRLAVPDSGGSS